MNRDKLTIIGTAHVSKNSVEEVKDAIYEQQPDVVAIELDRARYTKLRNRLHGIEEDEEIPVTKIIKENKVGVFLASTILGYFQSKIGAELDIDPGAEMVGAMEACEDLQIPIALIDRDINITMQRTLNHMTFFEKMKFLISSVGSIFGSDEEEIDVEDLKNPENIAELMDFFKDEAPGAHKVLVAERDAYLAGSIYRLPQEHIIAVVGAGHKEGILNYLDNPETIPPRTELVQIDKKGIPWVKVFLALIPVLFVVIFFLAFINGINIGTNVLYFVVICMVMGFLGSILSGSKLLSAIVGGLVAPLTVIHPLLAAGWFSGLTEAKLRKVKQSDIKGLHNIESIRDLWNNNIIRILLVVIGTNIAVTIATLVILPSQVFIPLFMQMY